MKSSVIVQKQVRDNASDLNNYVKDLQHWEEDMKRKEAEITGELDNQDIPPVRSKTKKVQPATIKQVENRIPSSDYSSWEKYDVDKACEMLDEEIKSTPSLDSKKSEEEKQAKLLQEAQYEKEKGNAFVKVKKWDAAIECYNRAINLNDSDATFYANRALCHLKKDNLHAAEDDCTSALELDPKYVKALLRRSTAREGLGSLRRAAADLSQLLQYEPDNDSVRKQHASLVARMGTKGPNSKVSPAHTPVESDTAPVFAYDDESVSDMEIKSSPIVNENTVPKVQEFKTNNKRRNSRTDDVVVQAIEKPPHLRSHTPLIRIPISEIPKGSSVTAISLKTSANELTKTVVKHINKKSFFKPNNTRQKYEDYVAMMGSKSKQKKVIDLPNVEDLNVPKGKKQTKIKKVERKEGSEIYTDENSNVKNEVNEKRQEYSKDNDDSILPTDVPSIEKLSIPKSSVQFISDWRLLKGRDRDRSSYLSAIPPANLPRIFKESLESDLLSEILYVLLSGEDFNKEDPVPSLPYLISLSEVKRFSTLAMFLTTFDKEGLLKILQRCKEGAENRSEEDINQVKNKYEI